LSRLGRIVRYRTAAIWSFVLVGGMFAVPAIIWAVFLPSLKHGLPGPIPGYERMLLDFAVFCGSWKWLLAIPIPVVLFTIAAFTSASRRSQQNSRARRFDDHAGTRPVGITVIASLNILAGFALGVSEMTSSHQPEGGFVWILVAGVIVSIVLGVGLLKLQNWARAFVIVLYGLSLIRMLGHTIFVHSAGDVLTVLVPGSYVLWAVWYMHRPQVRASFQRLPT
jgi:hypothetical protein